jgi:hypothetical protein
MNALARIDVGKLAKVCALFGSNQMGERAAAVYRADQIVRGAGLTWAEVLGSGSPAGGSFETSPPHEFPPSPGAILARHGDQLTGWERGFLTSLIRRPRNWTAKQRHILQEIRDRVTGAAR